jgi:hypothetical protein
MRGYLLLSIAVFGCSSAPPIGEPATGAGGGASGGDASSAIVLGAGGQKPVATTPTIDQNCGNSASTMTPVPADLLLVLDRSGSMTNDIGKDEPCDTATGACSERWATMGQAMRKVLASSSSTIRWGLKLFSTPALSTGLGDVPAGCVVVPEIEVPVGVGSSDAIVARMGATTLNYNTPTRAAVQAATSYLASLRDDRAKYLLLATDGQPNCPSTGDVPTAPDLPAALEAIAAARAAGIKVYVIGVGPSAGNLDEMARQGGTDKFFPALSPASLVAALDTIVGTVASCVYTMASIPPDPTNLGVYLDKQLVPEGADGWSLSGSNSVVFGGVTCERIKAGAFTHVQVLFGCPGSTTLPPSIP